MAKKEYKISINNDDWVTPEETLLDSGSKYTDLERPISGGIFRGFFIEVILGALILIGFTFKLSVIDYSYFNNFSLQNSSANFYISAPRGIIFDRNEKALVSNIATFDLLAISREIKKDPGQTQESLKKISKILNVDAENLNNDVSRQLKSNSIFYVARDLDKDKLLKISYLAPRGFYLIPTAKRTYIDGHQFSSIIGYIGKVNKEDLKNEDYLSTDYKGRLGLEAEYEEYLRGEHGKIFFGKEGEKSENSNPISGDNLVLSIDADLQKRLYSDLFEILKSSNLDKAAAIIQNPQNGEVLAMVSFPGYDNNTFINGLSENNFKRLFESRSRPLFNRAISGQYNPGSTIKPFMGLAILEEKIFNPQDNIKDCVSLSLGNAIFKNWREEYGYFNLRKSIANSCNIYFFTGIGGFGNIKGVGIDKISKYLKSAIADKILGIDVPGEKAGFVPDPEWKLRERGESWYQGDTYNISIGQGDLLVTPLWLNSYVSAIVNGGILYKPRVVKKVVDENKNVIQQFDSEIIGKLEFQSNNIQEVRDDMEETVLSGTAQIFKDLPVKAGAKTGTAEVIKGQSVNSLFTIFAPFEKPEIAMTILVEGSSTNQGLAIRAAHQVLKWYFEREK